MQQQRSGCSCPAAARRSGTPLPPPHQCSSQVPAFSVEKSMLRTVPGIMDSWSARWPELRGKRGGRACGQLLGRGGERCRGAAVPRWRQQAAAGTACLLQKGVAVEVEVVDVHFGPHACHVPAHAAVGKRHEATGWAGGTAC